MFNRAYSLLEIKEFDEDKRIITGLATTPAPDRFDDIVEPKGAEFKLPVPLLWQHDSRQPIGEVTNAKVTGAGIEIRAKLARIEEAGRLKDRLDEAWQSIKAGLVRGLSIGFQGLETSRIEGSFGIRYIRWVWLELSAVTIPANEQATITSIKSIDAELLAVSGQGKQDGSDKTPAGVTARKSTHVVKAKEAKRTMSKRTIADALASWEATRKQKETERDELEAKAVESEEILSAEEKDKLAVLEQEIKEVDEQIDLLRKRQARSAEIAVEVKGANPEEASRSRYTIPAQPIRARKQVEPGTAFVRFCQVMMACKGDIMHAERMAMSRGDWQQETPEVIDAVKATASFGSGWTQDFNLIMKAAVSPGTTTDSNFASALVNYQIMASEFIEYLRPLTIIGRLPGLRRVPFKVKIPRQTGGGTAAWVGERGVKPVTSQTFDTVTFEFAKIAAIVVLSEELVRFSNPSAEAVVRQDLTNTIVQYMDAQFVDPTVAAVTNVSPASITNGVTPVTATGTTAAALRADLKNVLDNFLANNIPLAGIVGIMTQSQALAISLMQTSLGTAAFPGLTAQGGTLAGIPVVTSENIPATGGSPTDGYPIIWLRAQDILLADDGQVSIDASREASLQMDSAPTSPPNTDTVLLSLWQHNLVGLRAERFINWGKARTTAVEFIQNAKYAE